MVKAGLSWKTPALGLAFLLLIGPLMGCGPKPIEPLRITGSTMGTTWSLVLPDSLGRDAAEIKAEFDAELADVNRVMSTYDSDSVLSRFNTQHSADWFPVDDSLVHLVDVARGLSELSEGAYDVTVGPVVNAWGFGPGSAEDKVPDPAALADVMAKVGYRHLETRAEPPALRKRLAGLYVDLSSIAKGYGVDRLADRLEAQGYANYMVEIGGELRTKGKNPRGVAWTIGLQRPEPGNSAAIQRPLYLLDGALATSGDYNNYFEEDGVRYSHTIDARTGTPISHRLASVSVHAQNCALADAWATALMVLGEKAGFELAQQLNLAALFLYKEGDEFTERHTNAFSALLTENAS